jgi:hypothetical protein
MRRRKLSDEERGFQKLGSGIPLSRWWPVLAALLAALIVAATTSHLFLDCAGIPLESRGRGIAGLKMLLAYPCSPLLLGSGMADWPKFALLWAPVPFAVVNWRWAARQRRYWNRVRLREAERRKAKRRADKAGQNDGSQPRADGH